MASAVVKADKRTMGDVIEWTLRYARRSPENFVIGPFDNKQVLKDGLELVGDIDNIAKQLTDRFGDKIIIDVME